MAEKESRVVTLPSGLRINVPASMTDAQVMARARYEGLLKPEDEGWLKSHFKAGLGATEATGAGIASLFGEGPEQSAAVKRFKEEGEQLSGQYPSLSDVVGVAKSSGLAKALSNVPEAAGYDIARMLPELGLTAAAAAAAPEVAGLSVLAPTAVSTLGHTGRFLNEQQARIDYLKQHPEEVTSPDDLTLRRGQALGAAVPAGLLDTALLGRISPFKGAAQTTEGQLMKEAAGKTGLAAGAKRAVTSMLGTGAQEAGTEVAQEALQRAQAREAMTSPEAYEAYLSSGLSGGVLGGGLGTPRAVLRDAGAAGRAQEKMSELGSTADAVLKGEAPLDPAQFAQYGKAMAKAFSDRTQDAENPEDIYSPAQAYAELQTKLPKGPVIPEAFDTGEEPIAAPEPAHVAGKLPEVSGEDLAATAYKDIIEAFKNRQLQDEAGNLVQDMPTAHRLGMAARKQAIADYAGTYAPVPLRPFQQRAQQVAAEQAQAPSQVTGGNFMPTADQEYIPQAQRRVLQAQEQQTREQTWADILQAAKQQRFDANVERIRMQDAENAARKEASILEHQMRNGQITEDYRNARLADIQRVLGAIRDQQVEAGINRSAEGSAPDTSPDVNTLLGITPANMRRSDIAAPRPSGETIYATPEGEASTDIDYFIAKQRLEAELAAKKSVADKQEYLNNLAANLRAQYEERTQTREAQQNLTATRKAAIDKEFYAKQKAIQDARNLLTGVLAQASQRFAPSESELLGQQLAGIKKGELLSDKEASEYTQQQAAAKEEAAKQERAAKPLYAGGEGIVAPSIGEVEAERAAREQEAFFKQRAEESAAAQGESQSALRKGVLPETVITSKTLELLDPVLKNTAIGKRVAVLPNGISMADPIALKDVVSALERIGKAKPEVAANTANFTTKLKEHIAKLGKKAPEKSEVTKQPEKKPSIRSEPKQPIENPHSVESLHQAIQTRYGKDTMPVMELSTREAEGMDADTKGFYDPDTKRVVLIADNISQDEDVHGLVRHEVAVHAKQLGKSDAEFKSILQRLEALRNSGDKAVQAAYAKVPKDTPAENINEEALGYLVEHAKELPIVKRFMSWLRRMVNKLTGNADWLKADDFVKMADEVLKQPSEYTGAGGVKFSKANTFQADIGPNRQRINTATEALRPTFLKALSAAGIEELATERLLPGAKLVLEVTRKMIGAQNGMQDDYAHLRQDINKYVQKNPAKVGLLGDIAMSATLLGVKMGSAKISIAEAKQNLLKTKPKGYQEDIKRLDSLERDWSRLGKEGQDIYNKMSKYYKDSYTRYVEAQFKRIDNALLTQDEKDKRRAKLTDLLESTRVKGDYFPVMRFGKYGVSYTEIETDPTTGAETESETKYTKFDTAAEAKAFLSNPKVYGKIYKDIHRDISSMGVDAEAMKELYDDIDATAGKDAEETRSDLKDIVMQMYLMSRSEQSIAKQFIHRKGTAGYSNDIFRGFDRYAMSMSRQLPRLEHSRGIEDLLKSMKVRLPMTTVERSHPDYEKQQNDSLKAQDYFEAFQNEILNSVHPKPVGAPARFLTGAAFHYYLSSVGSSVMQLASVPMLGLPAIAKQHSFGLASSAIKAATDMYIGSKANADIGWWNIGRGAATDKKAAQLVRGAKHAKEFDPVAAYKAFMDEGVITSTVHAQSYGGGGLPTGAEKDVVSKIYNVMDKVASPFGQMEAASRQIVSMASYIANMKSGMTHEQAVRNAIELVYRDMGDYGATGRSALSKSDAGRVLWQFQQYGAKMLTSIAASVRDMKYGSVEEKRQAKRHLMGILAMHGTFAGALGLPGVSLIGMVADAIRGAFGDDDDKYDYDTDLRNYLLNEGVDKTFTNVLLEGPIATLTGLDLRPRIGSQDIIPLIRESNSKDSLEESIKDRLLENFGGASVSMILNIAKGFDAFAEGNMGSAAEKLMPNAALRNAISGVRYAVEGKTTKQGEAIVPSEEMDLMDIVARSIGIEPLEVAKTTEAARTAKTYETFINNRHAALLKEFRKALEEGDTTEVEAKIEKFNQKYPEKAITGANLSESVGASSKRKAETVRGYNYGKLRERFLQEYPDLMEAE